MEKYQFKAGAGSAAIVFSQEMFPTDHLYGVHADPALRLIVLDAGERAAIVSAEMVNISGELLDDIRRVVAEKTQTPFDNVWMHVTHAITTPHAPGGPFFGKKPPEGKRPGPPQGPPPDPDAPMKNKIYTEAVLKATNEAAAQAADIKPARYGFVKGTTNVNINRDFDSGFGWWVKQNPDEYSNKEMPVLKIEDTDGKLIGVLVSADLKPCCIDQSGREDGTALVDPDVPGYACKACEKELGAPVMFCMAAAGDQVTREQSFWEDVDEQGNAFKVDEGVEKGFELVEKLGKEMAGEISAAVSETKCDISETAVVLARGSVTYQKRKDSRRQKNPVKEIAYEADGEAELGIMAIALGDELAFAAVKPEVNSCTGRSLKERSPFDVTILMSMVNGGMKYMPDKLSYDRCTWEAGSTSCMPGTAEIWTDGAVKLLNGLKEK